MPTASASSARTSALFELDKRRGGAQRKLPPPPHPPFRRHPRGPQKKTKYFFGVGLGVSKCFLVFQGSRKTRHAIFAGRGAAGVSGHAANEVRRRLKRLAATRCGFDHLRTWKRHMERAVSGLPRRCKADAWEEEQRGLYRARRCPGRGGGSKKLAAKIFRRKRFAAKLSHDFFVLAQKSVNLSFSSASRVSLRCGPQFAPYLALIVQ